MIPGIIAAAGRRVAGSGGASSEASSEPAALVSYATLAADLGAVAFWGMDDASGTTVADSIGARDLAFTGSGYTRDETALYDEGRSTAFGSSTASIPVSSGNDPFTSATRSFVLWYTLEGSGEQRMFDWKDSNMFMFLRATNPSTGACESFVGGGSLASFTLPANADPHFLAWVYDGTTLKVYADAVEVLSLTQAAGNTGGDRYIGRRRDQTNSYWRGSMQGIAAFNSALTAAQVQDLYDAGQDGL